MFPCKIPLAHNMAHLRFPATPHCPSLSHLPSDTVLRCDVYSSSQSRLDTYPFPAFFWVYRLFTFLFPTSCYWWHHGPSPCSLSLHWFWHSLLSHGQQTIIFFNLSSTHLLLYIEILMDISASLWFYNEQPVYKQRDSWKETSPNCSLGFLNLSDWSTPLVHNCRNPKPYVRFKQIPTGWDWGTQFEWIHYAYG